MRNIPPAPPDWNKTIADLMAEVDSGARRSVGSPEIDWARDFERSLLPPETRFPREGEIYEALEDVVVTYLTSWAGPFTGGGKAEIHKGEKLVIRYAPEGSRPVMVYADAVDHKSVESRSVPPAELRARGYEGSHLAIRTIDLNQKFLLMDD
jgi:hypothetical protein